MTIFDKTMGLLERAMDLRGARHRVIASNIANEETPGYRARELEFRDALSSATKGNGGVQVRVTNPRHVVGRVDGVREAGGRIAEVPSAELPLDANSVNLDVEMAKLMDNAMQYNTQASVIALRFRQLLSVIRDAR
ncbi:flagellar basal body rod protein FlgB [Candidatus Nitrospira bockiana]